MKSQITQCRPVNASDNTSTLRVRRKKRNKKVQVRNYALAPIASFASDFNGDEVFGVPSCCFDHV